MTDTPVMEPGTALPWQSHGSHLYGPDPQRDLVAQFLSDEGRLTRDLAFAIRACNSFPALLAFAEMVRDRLNADEFYGDVPDEVHRAASAAISLARSDDALAKGASAS